MESRTEIIETVVQAGETVTIPVIVEEITVDKRVTEAGGVRIVKTVHSEDVTVREPTVRESASVERVPVNRLLDASEPLPKARREGDTMVIPLFEEVVVSEKRTRLVEELRITMTRTEEPTEHIVTIRREAVHTEPLGVTPVLPNTQGVTN